MLQGRMKGRAAKKKLEDGRTRTMPARVVLSYWDISPTAVELQLQRLRRISTIVRDPGKHEQVIMGVFGTTRLDECVKRRRLDSTGRVHEHSAPWAKR
eukprot:1518587-Pyramimonas_sp.AAC.1